jgi:transcriptional regulator with XRE-family HTH domain
VDDLGLGRAFRELRLRLGWRQRDVARKAGVSDSTYSRIERGDFDRMSLRVVRRVGEVLEVRLHLQASWRGSGLDRLLSSRHSAMTEVLTRRLLVAGWEVRPEVSFNIWGERGVVDIAAWHAASRALLLVELKTELVDVNRLLATTDRRRRLGAAIAKQLGWEPVTVSQWVVLAEGRTNRRRVADHRAVLRSAFPADGRAVGGWLASPIRAMSALWFLPDRPGARARASFAPVRRVRQREASGPPAR